MRELHKGPIIIGENVESKEGERGPLCSNKANLRSPSLEYIFTPNTDDLNSAFDILFEEVVRKEKNEMPWNHLN